MTAVAASRHASNDSSFRRGNIRCVLDLLHAASLADESFDGGGALQIARSEGMSGIAFIIEDRMQHLKAVKEHADLLKLTSLERNQYVAEQCHQRQRHGVKDDSIPFVSTDSAEGLREGTSVPLLLPPSSSPSPSSPLEVTPVASGGKTAALTKGTLGVETKAREATKVLPAAKTSNKVTTNMKDGNNVVAPVPSDTATDVAEEKAGGDAGPSVVVDTGVPLKDNAIYAQYFKMVKMGVPPSAVQHKMMKDNASSKEGEKVDPSVLDLDPEKSLESQKHLLKKKSEEEPKKKSLQPKVITGQKTAVTTTPLHWDALPETVLSHHESLWKSDTNPLISLEALKMIEENFEANCKSAVVVSQAVPAEKGQMILGTKWANNTSITMKPFSMAGVANMYDLVHLVSSLSSNPVVTLERAESLLILLQTIDRTELEAIREFSGDPADLCRPDRFIHITMKEQNRFLEKLEMFCFVLRFDVVINDLRELANKMLAACNEIYGNHAIGRLLCSLLRVGNVVNENSKARSGRAVPAVHLGALFKAALKKGKSASMVDVAVINLLGWNGDEVHPIVPALESVKIAERIDMEYILQEMEVVQDGLQMVKKEITLEKKKQPSEKGETGDSFIQNASAFLENGRTLLEEIQTAVHAAKAKISDVFASLGLPQSGENAMKTDELFDTTLKLAAAADASMTKCRKNGRGKKMEDEEIQKLQQQHQEQQRKEKFNSNIDRDQSRPPETGIVGPSQVGGQGNKKSDEESSLQQRSRKNLSQNAEADDEDVADQTLQAPPAAPPAPADPRAAMLSAIAARKKPDDDDQDEDDITDTVEATPAPAPAPAPARAPADPRAAMPNAIKSRQRDGDERNSSITGGGTAQELVADDEDVAEQTLQAPPAAAVAVPAPADPREALLSAIRSRQ